MRLPPKLDERVLRAPTPPPMLPRRGVPMPARPLALEPVDPTPSLAGPRLDQYVRNQDPGEPVPILRDLPFGNALGTADTPFFMDSGPTGSVDLDEADTDGIPTGLPDLLGFTDVALEPSAEPASPEEPAPVLAPVEPAAAPRPVAPVDDTPTFGPVGLGVAFVLGLVVGAVAVVLL
ncbi:MAG: hypothetical protein KC656_08975 [Myxococcales bacterium]|nr:hypothetical protein [Myxococcales bacterium]MCB9669715.1 hypothetical protein [Alphaproteobacteria bacterium]